MALPSPLPARAVRTLTLAVVLTVALAACSDDGDGSSASEVTAPPASDTATSAPRDTTPAAETPAAPSEGCTATPVAAGATPQTVPVDGTERTYRRFLPADYDGTTPLPVVLNFHGLSSNAEQQTALSELEPFAEEQGFIVLAPQGTGTVPFWNSVLAQAGPDDVGFVSALLDEVERSLCVDTRRVFTTGLSNGGLMSSLLACTLGDRIAAAAPVSGVRPPEECGAGRLAPMTVFYGDADVVLPYDGGVGDSVRSIVGGQTLVEGQEAAQQSELAALEFPPVPEVMADWAAALDCAAQPDDERVARDVVAEEWPGCADDAELLLYTVEDGGHTWPGSVVLAGQNSNPTAGAYLGRTTTSVSANELMWEFFLAHPLPA